MAAVMTVVPAAIETTVPLEPGAVPIAATPVADELQRALAVRSFVDLSAYVPITFSCMIDPAGREGSAGVTVMLTGDGDDTTAAGPPPPEPQAVKARMIARRTAPLFDLIDTRPLRHQIRRVGAALEMPHVPPFLHNDPGAAYLLGPSTTGAGGLSQCRLVLSGVGPEERRQIGMNQPLPGDAEDDA